MVIPDFLTKVNKTLGYYPMVSTLTTSQHRLLDNVRERNLIDEETTNHHLHQKILVEIPTQITITMLITTKMEAIAGAGEADIWNATLEDHRFQEIPLPILGRC